MSTTSHDRWFVILGATNYEDCIRCECGATFGGLIAWARHGDAEDAGEPIPATGDAQ